MQELLTPDAALYMSRIEAFNTLLGHMSVAARVHLFDYLKLLQNLLHIQVDSELFIRSRRCPNRWLVFGFNITPPTDLEKGSELQIRAQKAMSVALDSLPLRLKKEMVHDVTILLDWVGIHVPIDEVMLDRRQRLKASEVGETTITLAPGPGRPQNSMRLPTDKQWPLQGRKYRLKDFIPMIYEGDRPGGVANKLQKALEDEHRENPPVVNIDGWTYEIYLVHSTIKISKPHKARAKDKTRMPNFGRAHNK